MMNISAATAAPTAAAAAAAAAVPQQAVKVGCLMSRNPQRRNCFQTSDPR